MQYDRISSTFSQKKIFLNLSYIRRLIPQNDKNLRLQTIVFLTYALT
jgi:hypothetical protein